jgi:putative DNA primase/helicase
VSPDSPLAAALAYVRAGLRVFPLGVRSKKPMRSTADGGRGVHDATVDAAVVASWWAAESRANIGIACGPESDLLIIDVDGPVGSEELAALERQHAPLPPTRQVTSGRDDGGTHYWFRWPPGVESVRGKLGKKIDVLGRGRYVVAPPSVHPTGRRYEADETPIAQAPAWLVALIAKEDPRPRAPLRIMPGTQVAVRRARAYLSRIPGAVSGQHGHDHTFHVACALVEGFALSIEEARPLLEEWNQTCDPPWSQAEIEHKLADAAKKATRPGYLLGDEGRECPEPFAASTPSPAGSGTPPCAEMRTELGNARRIVRCCGRDLRWTAAHRWLAWDGKRWRPDDIGAAMRAAKKAIRGIFDEAKAAARAGDAADAERLASWAAKSQKAAVIKASLDLAASEPEIALRAEAFDQDPLLLNVANGTIDLRTGELRGHGREDLITRLTAVSYDPDATCPEFERFLARVQPDEEVRAYLQRHAGYCLTGDTSDQSFDVAHGPGANGKSTYYDVLGALLGDYAKPTPFSTFLARRDRGEASNDLADLAGARLVVAAEPPEGARLNIALVKQLTGEDTIKARFLYREYFAFPPTFKIVLVANHRPRIAETTEAAWRRVHLIPWSVVIPKAERDGSLKAKLRAELPGILAWAVRGAAAWRREGLQAPARILAATEAYRQDEDAVGTFLAECCVTGQAYQVQATPLLRAFDAWAVANGERETSAKALGTRLGDMGFEVVKRHGRSWWLGIGLLADRPTGGDPEGEDGEDRRVGRGTSANAPSREDFPGESSNPPHAPPAASREPGEEG